MKQKFLTPLTPKKVQREIEKIKEIAPYDDEEAHTREDNLWRNTLEAIANGAPHPRALAREALKTKYIEFGRWTS